MIKMLFSRTVNTPFENKLFTWTANIYFIAVDKWVFLRPVGLVRSTHGMCSEPEGTEQQYTNPINWQAKSDMTSFVDLYCRELHSTFRLSGTTPGRAQPYLLWKICVLSLVLKTKCRKVVFKESPWKCCLCLLTVYYGMLSLFKICCGICLKPWKCSRNEFKRIVELWNGYWAMLKEELH